MERNAISTLPEGSSAQQSSAGGIAHGTARVAIGAFQFHNKRAAELHIRDILARLRITSRSSIAASTPQHLDTGARRFVVRHRDSSWRDFTWRHAIYPRPMLRRLSGVLRWAVRDQTLEYRDRHFEGQCVLCLKPIQLNECHVDHIPPDTFQRLVANWLLTVRLTAEDIAIQASAKYETESRLEDQVLEQSWQEYHAINARLRCVCKRCNLSIIRKTSPAKKVE